MRFRTLPCAVILLAVVMPAVAQDLTIASKLTVNGKPGETQTSYLSAARVRVPQGESTETIFDKPTGQMTTLDVRKKTYSIVTKKEMDEFAAKQKQQAAVPQSKEDEEGMKAFNAMMGGMVGELDVKKLGTTRKIAGYGCANWEMTMGKMSRTEECLSEELKIPTAVWEMYRTYSESMKLMMAPMMPNMEKAVEKMKAMKGYPLAYSSTIDVMGNKTTMVSEVTEVKTGPIPASVWEIPAGYKKVESPMLRDPRARR